MISVAVATLLLPSCIYFYLRIVGWFSGPECSVDQRLDGRVVVVTGGNSGIGKETVRELAKRGAKVITGCRDLKKAKAVADSIKKETGEDIQVEYLDLADLKSSNSLPRSA